MITFATIVMDPAGFAAWMIVGAICGWLAGKMMEAPSYGILGEVFLGVMGGLIGGIAFSLSQTGVPNFWVTVLVALIGACIGIGGGRIVAASRAT